ncbi:sensor histidine kinase [Pseudomonas sp. S2_H01]
MTNATDCGRAWSSSGAAMRGIILLLMLIFFLLESIGPFGTVASFFYILVVAISGEAGDRRWVIIVASGSGLLTVLSNLLFHDSNLHFSLEACLASLLAIYIVAHLVLGKKEAKYRLTFQQQILHRTQALLESTQNLSAAGSISFLFPSMDMQWSVEAKRICGFDRNDSPLISDLLRSTHVDDHDLVLQTIQGLCCQQSSTDSEFRLVLADRKTRIIRFVASPIGSVDELSEVTVILIDVTSARESEDRFQQHQAELAHINRVMVFNEIIASIAHEVNQPLAAVVTSAQSGLRWLNRETPNLAEVDLALLRVVEQTNRTSTFMNNLREHSVESVRVAEPTCIREIFKSADILLKREARAYQIDVSFHINSDTPLVAADRVQIQHVIMNLVSNSIEAVSQCSSGVREIIIVASRSISGDLSVSVRDSGTGIRSEHFENLFIPFFTTKKHGVGVGLAICRSIVEAHGGRIWAGSERRAGAIFNFSLPQLGKVSI